MACACAVCICERLRASPTRPVCARAADAKTTNKVKPWQSFYPVRVHADVNWHSAIRAGVAHLEERIASILTTYQAAVTGLPMTERLPDPFAEIAV